MHRRSRGWDWVKGAIAPGMICVWMCLCGMAAGQAPAAPEKPPTQTPAPLTQDADPVATPDPVTAVPGAATPVEGQSGQVTKENGRYTLRADTFEVRLNASVIDSSGHAVDTLPQDAFHVYEDGVPQTILGFRHEDLPVSLGILIDSSGSMYDKRPAVDAASLNLVKLSNPQDEAFLVDFSSEAYIDQDFTDSIAKLQRGLSYIKSSGGGAW